MKIIFSVVIILIFFSTSHVYSKTITFLGDSRADMLGGLKINPNKPNIFIRDSEYASGSKEYIIRQEERDAMIFIDQAQSMSPSCIWPVYVTLNNIKFNTDISIISLGGNDVLLPMLKVNHAIPTRVITQDIYNRLTGVLSKSIDKAWLSMCILSWYAEVTADIASMNNDFLIKYILNQDVSNKNCVLLNDIAPIVLTKITSERLEFKFEDVFLANCMVEVMNLKYRDNLIPRLQKIYGENRVQFLSTTLFFYNVIAGGPLMISLYYQTDGIHFTDLGNIEWGRMIAKRLASLGWLQRNESLCLGDSIPPSFICPSGGVFHGLGAFGVVNAPIPLAFFINDGGRILDVQNAEQVGGGQYVVLLNTNISMGESGQIKVKAMDVCGNSSGMQIDYYVVLTSIFKLGWGFYTYDLYYKSTPI